MSANEGDAYALIAPIYDEWHELLSIQWVSRLENHLARYGVSGEKGVASRSWLWDGHPPAGSAGAALGLGPHGSRGERGDVVGCFFDGFNHLLADGALAQTFQRAAAAMVPGGLLMFDLNNRDGCEDLQNGPAAHTVLRRRCFASGEVTSALDGAGFDIELEQTWSFARGLPAGKTWYVTRKRSGAQTF